MEKATATTAFSISVLSGIFTYIKVDPNVAIAKVFYLVIDSICPPGYDGTCSMYKLMIFITVIVLPLIFDAILIIRSGGPGIVSAIFGFLGGLTAIPSPIVGAILLLVGFFIATRLGV